MQIDKKDRQIPLTAAILSVAFFQMAMVALAPVISAMSEAFPNASPLTLQIATTFLNLVQVAFSLLSGRISKAIGRRYMAALGMALYVLVGALGRFCSVGLWAVFLWSGLLGAGTGMFVPAIFSLMLICYEPEPRATVTGLETTVVNLGGVILSLLSGVLAAKYWSNAYLCFLLAIPAFVLCLRCMPDRIRERELEGTADAPEKAGGGKLPLRVWLATLTTFVFGIVYFTFSTNVSFLLGEKGLDPTAMAGVVTAAFMLGGAGCGLLFKKFASLCRDYTPMAAFALLAFSYVVLSVTRSVPVLLICAFIGGGSLSFIFPYLLLSVGGSVDPALSVMTSSLIISVGPNLGSFVSPVIVTNLASALLGDTAGSRFRLAAVIAVLSAAVLIVSNLRKAKKN